MTTEEKFVWGKEIPVPAHLITYVDDEVVSSQEMPPGTKVLSISPSGASYWARTAKIEAVDAEGNETPFFIKVHIGAHGRKMVSGEFEGMKRLHQVGPEIVAEPLGWGIYESNTDASFFVCRYHELSGDIPEVSDFPELLAEMHKSERAVAPTGEFGFGRVTYGGRNPVFFPMCRTWEECFSAGLALTFDLEQETHGPEELMTQLRESIMTKVIPRLLRPLETEGRKIVPTLCHGDMWDGNASVDVNTGKPMIFDATPLYAHNEYELGPMWPTRHKMTMEYINEYTKYYPIAEPEGDFYDRIALYCLRFDLHASSLYYGNPLFRNISKDAMKTLIEKYAGGYEAYQKERGLA
ncbi:Fructosamine kinase-domain-containing protein [Xylariaceae sp. FL1019]|nr:Fructosamine kinase-domain-containing protein [Xylariaceae sp. FL1019]